MTKKKTAVPAPRGKWEVTFRNLRAIKAKMTKLERRVQALERRA
jgi:hypothetical protein